MLISTKEAARQLGLSIECLTAWRVKGVKAIPYYKFGKSVRYEQADVDAYRLDVDSARKGLQSNPGRIRRRSEIKEFQLCRREDCQLIIAIL